MRCFFENVRFFCFSRRRVCLTQQLVCALMRPSLLSRKSLYELNFYPDYFSILSRVVSLSSHNESTTQYTDVLLLVNASLSPRILLHLKKESKDDVEKRRVDDEQHSAMGDEERDEYCFFFGGGDEENDCRDVR